MDQYQQYIALSRYARFNDETGMREQWRQTVDRYFNYWVDKKLLKRAEANNLANQVFNLEGMPSMRALMTAGPALDRDHVAGYNCSYLPIDSPRAYDELLYVLMCGTGVGYSVENRYISKLPRVAEEMHDTDTVIRVQDSKIGWAKAYRELLSLLYVGQIPSWDVSRVRPSGARLKTFGGRASGPDPLVELFEYTVNIFRGATGRQLTDAECSDLVCKVAQVVVVGGVRRSALICLCDLESQRMRHYKMGEYYLTHPERGLANISAVYEDNTDFQTFYTEWGALYESTTGERGIFSRTASQAQAAATGRRDPNHEFGTNPCSEIILRPYQFCNLSEVVVRPEDTLESLKQKVELTAILGTLQSTLTDFRYLRKIWKDNTEEERLLGVSLTGIMDHEVMSGQQGFDLLDEWLEELHEHATKINEKWAKRLGIPQSVAITCVKPSGTVSQLVDSASGIHGRVAPYYIRRVRNDKKDPLSQLMIDQGIPHEEDVLNPNAWVFDFPKYTPAGDKAIYKDDIDPIWHLNLWDHYQRKWCDHKPSATITYNESNFLHVGAWLWDNLDSVSGVSFMPYFENTSHVQLPEEPISKERYEELKAAMPELDWSRLPEYEAEDNTIGQQTLACVGNNCEL